ncbi:hypothetical protein ISCGN_003501 [Ixodes scapularis]
MAQEGPQPVLSQPWKKNVIKQALLVILLLNGQSRAGRLNPFVRHYEPLSYPPQHSFASMRSHAKSKRSVPDTADANVRFSAYGRAFHLLLRRDRSVFADDFVMATSSRGVVDVNLDHIYSGKLDGDPGSRVFGSLVNGVFEGHIATSEDDTFYLEPSWKYRDQLAAPAAHSVIYSARDVELPPDMESHGGCGLERLQEQMARDGVSKETRTPESADAPELPPTESNSSPPSSPTHRNAVTVTQNASAYVRKPYVSHEMWQEQQDELFPQLESPEVDLAGDEWGNSSGFSAKYMTYPLHAAQLNKILHFEQVQDEETRVESDSFRTPRSTSKEVQPCDSIFLPTPPSFDPLGLPLGSRCGSERPPFSGCRNSINSIPNIRGRRDAGDVEGSRRHPFVAAATGRSPAYDHRRRPRKRGCPQRESEGLRLPAFVSMKAIPSFEKDPHACRCCVGVIEAGDHERVFVPSALDDE